MMGLDPSSLPDSFKRYIDPAIRKQMGKMGWTREEVMRRQVVRSEKELQKLIGSLLSYYNIPYIRPRMDKKTTTQVGTPDFIFSVGRNGIGQAVAWEIKMPREKLSTEQLDMMAKLYMSGYRIAVVRSVEVAIDELQKLGAKPPIA